MTPEPLPAPPEDRIALLLQRADALYHDLDYAAVAAWKVAHPGAPVIGYLPIWAPRELVHAAGGLPVGLHGAGSQVEIIRGDAYFQSYICQLPRSLIELGLTGRLDAFDGFLFPAICDVIRNLSGMWQILFPDRYVKYVDVPQDFDERTGGRFLAHELGVLRDDLARLAGRPVTDDDLRAAIADYNANQAALAELMALRRTEPWRSPVSEAYLVIRAGDLLPVCEHTEFVRAYVRAVREADRPLRDRSRVVMAGAFCEQPPLGLIRTLERAGCDVVWDDMTLGARWLKEPVATDGDPLAALARAFIHHSSESASLYQEDGQKGRALVETVRACRAEGVILAAPSFCDPALLDQPMLVSALENAGVPWTAFKYAENLGQFQVIREQAGTFADSIRLWSEP
jgi:benzoyl-CoA reductase subunit C